MKKIITLLLCAALALGLLAGCGAAETTSEEPAAEPTEAAETAAPTETAEASDPAGEETETLTLTEQLLLAREAYDLDTVVCTVNGGPVTWKLYYYLLLEELEELTYYTGALPEDFTEILYDDVTLEQYFRDVAGSKAIYYTLAGAKAEELGVILPEETEAGIQEYWDYLAESYGGEEALLEAMAPSCLDKDVFLFLLRGNEELAALMAELYGTQGEKLSAEEITAWAAEEGYVHIKHILYYAFDEAGEALDEEGMAALRTQAEATLAELKALQGGDTAALEARFDEIMNADSGDLGGLYSFPEGYTFTEGTMYPVFEEAAFALEEYEISEIVESQSGYHILLRLPLGTEDLTMEQSSATGEYLTLRASAANEFFSRNVAAWMKEAEVEWSDGFEALSLNELFHLK